MDSHVLYRIARSHEREADVVQSRRFSEMLAETIRKHQSRAIEAAQVIEELIGLAKQMRESAERGEKLHLTDDEVAFYGALEVNDSAVKVLGDETLRTIARELVETVRKNTTIDWTVRENIRAHLRVLVKRILRKYGYPPDKQEKATLTVLEQAEVLSANWATAEDIDLKAHVATISGCARAAHPTARSRNAFSWSSAQMRALDRHVNKRMHLRPYPRVSTNSLVLRYLPVCGSRTRGRDLGFFPWRGEDDPSAWGSLDP